MQARIKLGLFPQKESTHGLLSHVKKKRTKKEEKKFIINSKNAPSALERHRSQI